MIYGKKNADAECKADPKILAIHEKVQKDNCIGFIIDFGIKFR